MCVCVCVHICPCTCGMCIFDVGGVYAHGIYAHMVSVGMRVHVWCVYTVDMYMCGGGGGGQEI